MNFRWLREWQGKLLVTLETIVGTTKGDRLISSPAVDDLNVPGRSSLMKSRLFAPISRRLAAFLGKLHGLPLFVLILRLNFLFKRVVYIKAVLVIRDMMNRPNEPELRLNSSYLTNDDARCSAYSLLGITIIYQTFL